MPSKSKNIANIDEIGTVPISGHIASTRDEYIHALEISVVNLQREVENLRNQINIGNKLPSPDIISNIQDNFNDITSKYLSCSTDTEVLTCLHEQLSKDLEIIESNIFFFTPEKRLIPVENSNTSSTLTEFTKNLEEVGIIDWAVDKKVASIIPNLSEVNSGSPTFFILTPLFLRGTSIGIYVIKTIRDKDSFSNEELEKISLISSGAALALDNIRSSDEILKMNRRLAVLNTQMLKSSKLASIGELAASIANEIENPLQIISGHLNLIETGVGDFTRRVQIIKEQVEKINEIITSITNMAKSSTGEKLPAVINVCQLIDEVLLFTGFQLQRDGIKIDKEYESKDSNIKGFKPELEQVFMNLLLNARDSMPDGGVITIGVFPLDKKRVMVSIADNSIGIEENEIKNLFDPFYIGKAGSQKIGMGLFLTKNIIEQHKGLITIFSEVGKGTTFKIVLPLV